MGDSAGFGLAPSPWTGRPAEILKDPERIKADYFPRLIDYMQQQTGAPVVLPLNFVLRTSGTSSAIPEGKTQDVPKATNEFTGAIANVHADVTDESKLVALCRGTQQQFPYLTGGRFMVVNCWQPLRLVQSWPLAVCDARSVENDDLYSRYTPGNDNYVYNSLPSGDRHQWFFFPDMTVDEMLVFKSWDEGTDLQLGKPDVARQTLHSSFQDTASPADAPPRMSLELRLACFWPAGRHSTHSTGGTNSKL